MKATPRLDVSPSSGSAGRFLIRLGEGIDPNTVLEMWWPRSTDHALRGRVRRLARLSVRHDRLRSLVLAPFVEHCPEDCDHNPVSVPRETSFCGTWE
jgi:hypothetical protein